MEWLEKYWQILSVILAHIVYEAQNRTKTAMRQDQTDREILRIQRLLEGGLASSCQVHSQQIQEIEKQLAFLREKILCEKRK